MSAAAKKAAPPAESAADDRAGKYRSGTSLAVRDDEVGRQLEALGAGYNVLNPVVSIEGDDVSPLLRTSIQFVKVDPDENHGDVYHDPRFAPSVWDGKSQSVNLERSKFALTAQAISKIGAAAGVKWIPDRTGMVPGSRERRLNGHVYLRYLATAAVRQPNGEWHWEPTEVDMDTEDEAEEFRATYLRQIREGRNVYKYADAKKGIKVGDPRFTEEDVDGMVEREIMQLRKFLLRHAETKAKSRAIRRLLSLPQVLTYEEVCRPFAVPRLLYRPDFADPLELERIQIEGRRAESSIFGGMPRLEASAGSGGLPQGAGVHPAEPEEPAEGEGAAAARRSSDREVAAAPKSSKESKSSKDPVEDPVVDEGELAGKKWSELGVLAGGLDYLESIAKTSRSPKRKALAQFYVDQALGADDEGSGGAVPTGARDDDDEHGRSPGTREGKAVASPDQLSDGVGTGQPASSELFPEGDR